MSVDQRILITGAASGLGKALAEEYARNGWRVLVADVQTELGEQVAHAIADKYKIQTAFIKLDVTQDQDWQTTAEWIKQNWQGLDAIINNAGVACVGEIDQQPMSDWQWLTDINLLGVARGCHYMVPFIKASQGSIINVASMAGLMHLGGMSAYNASKAAVIALSETLAVELIDDNVSVSVVCPSFFKTNLGVGMRTTEPGAQAQLDWLMKRSNINADDVAKIVYEQSEQGKLHILPHSRDKYLWLAKRFVPTFMRKKLIQVSNKMKNKMRAEGVSI